MNDTKLLHSDPNDLNITALKQVAKRLREGAVVVFPTDTVYGIAVAVLDGATPEQLYAIKGRDSTKAIACLVPDVEALNTYAEDVRDHALTLARKHWPGALTLVVKAGQRIPQAFRAADGSIALRAPAHPIAQALLRELGAPLATSSANLSGEAAALAASELSPELAAAVDIIIDGGATPGHLPSTIVSCLATTPQIIREGAISSAALLLK